MSGYQGGFQGGTQYTISTDLTQLVNGQQDIARLLGAIQQAILGIGLGTERFDLEWSWGAAVASAGTITLGWAPRDMVVTGVRAALGTAGGSYDVAVLNNGTPIGNLGTVVVSSTTAATALATSGNTIVAGDSVSLVISNVTSSPTGGAIQVQGTLVAP